MGAPRLRCTYFVDSVQGGRQYMEDFICSTETETSTLCGKSVYNHKLLTDHETTFFGVFDGHGGPEAAKFAQCNLLREIMNQEEFSSSDEQLIVRALEEGFVSTSRKMWGAIGKVFSFNKLVTSLQLIA
jgi:serine/threonine protein phosphatase PrpC